MSSCAKTQRWLRVALCALAIPVGLVVMWKSAQWTLIGIRNVLELPDTGGHWFEFLMLDLLGFAVSALGVVTAATNGHALVATRLFARPFGDLSSQSRTVAHVAFVTAAITGMIAGIGLGFLFYVLLLCSVVP